MQIKPVLWCPYRALMFLNHTQGGASLALGFILAALQAA